MYKHTNSGATISNADFDKLPVGRIKSKYAKMIEAQKETKPETPKKASDKEGDAKS